MWSVKCGKPEKLVRSVCSFPFQSLPKGYFDPQLSSAVLFTSRYVVRGKVFVLSVCVSICVCWAATFEAVDIDSKKLHILYVGTS